MPTFSDSSFARVHAGASVDGGVGGPAVAAVHDAGAVRLLLGDVPPLPRVRVLRLVHGPSLHTRRSGSAAFGAVGGVSKEPRSGWCGSASCERPPLCGQGLVHQTRSYAHPEKARMCHRSQHHRGTPSSPRATAPRAHCVAACAFPASHVVVASSSGMASRNALHTTFSYDQVTCGGDCASTCRRRCVVARWVSQPCVASIGGGRHQFNLPSAHRQLRLPPQLVSCLLCCCRAHPPLVDALHNCTLALSSIVRPDFGNGHTGGRSLPTVLPRAGAMR